MNKKNIASFLGASALALASASAAVDLTPATAAIAEGVDAATAISVAGLGILAVFLVFKIIRRGMNRV